MTVKLITHKPDHIIALEIDGWIDAEDIDRITKLIEPRIDAGEKLRIYAEVSSWSGMSLGAFIKDLKFSLQHLNNFEKEAIVSDRKWLEALAALSNTLFSSIEVKHFTPDEKDKALEWVMS
ncbi:STAS/SEC14 domain-containing protein [Waterburya agarophytonicola K14]|uniref:STAS/SEC14 domain-containing protein n=1 Tax=Waterburya agarophytonicola KI4 TaxID=2874699 RepID=A0A964BS32_9CYAN|nr:STAS/SEC14 domain-containing protein [Waterburya agarophytonicola]MCC0177772.1 STAS/SEC14 domain-containing protein [Waterburya agarophytonicola KI4]